jgi:CMP-N-acetylneuraminic acid synthetase
MRVLIPARGQSKRIPRKNIAPLGGKPLIAWTIEAALNLPVKDVVVSTEDRQIADVAKSLGASVLMRPDILASDTATDDGVITHFASRYYDTEWIIYLRPTTPFRDESVLLDALSLKISSAWSSIRSIQEMPESAYKCFRRIDDMILPIVRDSGPLVNLPNQQCPKTYIGNGYIDIIFPHSKHFKADNVFGDCIRGLETPPTIELDTPEQWDYAEYLLLKESF